jgi:hypothetical protein
MENRPIPGEKKTPHGQEGTAVSLHLLGLISIPFSFTFFCSDASVPSFRITLSKYKLDLESIDPVLVFGC